MKYTLTKEQTEVITTDKQCVLIKGNRRSGKSFTGYSLTLNIVLGESRKFVFFIVPTLRHGINIIDDIVSMLGDCRSYIRKINKTKYCIEFQNSSIIYIFTPTDIFSYGFKGYERPDLIVIDDLEYFDKRTSKRILAIIKEDYWLRAWNCRFFITYYPVKLHDRCNALFRLAGNNKYWFRTEFAKERRYNDYDYKTGRDNAYW